MSALACDDPDDTCTAQRLLPLLALVAVGAFVVTGAAETAFTGAAVGVDVVDADGSAVASARSVDVLGADEGRVAATVLVVGVSATSLAGVAVSAVLVGAGSVALSF